MALKSMKVTKEDRKKREEMYKSPCIDTDDYPYGLRIHLDSEMLTKLGIKTLPKTGGTFTLSASGTIKSTEVNDREGKEKKSMSLQIEKLDVTV